MALIGSTGPNPYNHTTSQTFQVSIDGTKPYTTSTTDSDPPHYMQWYQSPLLSAGMHTIVLSALSGLAVDYVVITPAPDTLLTGETLMVDDSYEGISYSGNWQTTSNTTFAGGTIFYSHAFQNTSHQTSTVGDSFLFSYTGQPSAMSACLKAHDYQVRTSLYSEYSPTAKSEVWNYHIPLMAVLHPAATLHLQAILDSVTNPMCCFLKQAL